MTKYTHETGIWIISDLFFLNNYLEYEFPRGWHSSVSVDSFFIQGIYLGKFSLMSVASQIPVHREWPGEFNNIQICRPLPPGWVIQQVFEGTLESAC